MDGSPLSFQNWAGSASKTQDCVHLRYSGTWEDDNCNNAKVFVCKKGESKQRSSCWNFSENAINEIYAKLSL